MRIWVKGYLGLRASFADCPFVEVDAERFTVRDLLGRLEQPGQGAVKRAGVE